MLLSSIFQLTHPWGCDKIAKCVYLFKIWISTHTPVRVWHIRPIFYFRVLDFNSHTREGVTFKKLLVECDRTFQLTHPWGCDAEDIFLLTHHKFQLTHPWGCDVIVSCNCSERGWISTHTPVRVWQFRKRASYFRWWDFNSHTREGVTFCGLCMNRSMYFNSHTREGVTNFAALLFLSFWISTHTPVRVWLYL